MHVAVTSEHTLVSQAVAAALGRSGMRTSLVAWPRSRAVAPSPRAPITAPFDAGLLLVSLDLWARLRAARAVMSGIAMPWVVQTEAPRGPLWGAALTYGAAAVLPVGAALTTVVTVLTQAADGERLMSPGEAEELCREWALVDAAHEQTIARFTTLTPREREVVWFLYRGDSAAQIAVHLAVSLSTVRSQVKSILRKLGVNSQLAAVAAMRDYLELDPPRALPRGEESRELGPLGLRS